MKATLSFPTDQSIPDCIINWDEHFDVSGHYAFRLHACYPATVMPKQCLWKHAKLAFEDKKVLGVVTRVCVNSAYRTQDTILYDFTFESPLALLKRKYHTRSWVKPTVNKMFDELLFESGIHYKIRGNFNISESLCQFKQTDYDYFIQLCKSQRIGFKFEVTSDFPILTLSSNHQNSNSQTNFPVLSAVVSEADDNKAYKAIYAFGENVPMKLIQPNQNCHWPLQVSSSVYAGFYEGDFKAPLIIGQYAVNAIHTEEVNEHLSDQRQRLIANNQSDKQAFQIDQPRYENTLILQKKPKNALEMSTKQGALKLYIRKNLHEESKQSIYNVSYQAVVHAAGHAEWKAAKKIDMFSENKCFINAKTMQLNASKLSVNADKSLSICATNLYIQSDAIVSQSLGQTSVLAEKSLAIAANTIMLGARTAGIQLSPAGIQCAARQIAFNAGTVNLYGQWAGVSGASNWTQQCQSVSSAVDKQASTVRIHDILYVPADATFILLDEHEAQLVSEEAAHWDRLIQEVHSATASEKNAAKHRLNQHLSKSVEAPDQMRLKEVLSFHGKKWCYIRTEIMGRHNRRYRIDESEEAKSELTTGNGLDFKKLTKRFEILFDEIEIFDWSPFQPMQKAAFQWANDWNYQFKQSWWGHGENGVYRVDASASLMRYLMGISIKHVANIKKLTFSFNADINVKIDIATAQCHVSAYLPGEKGYLLQLTCQDKQQQPIHYNLGALRLEGQFTLSGYAGCSILANAHLVFKPHHGVMQLLGRNFETDKLDAFAGIRIGAQMLGDLCWYNPNSQAWLAFSSLGYDVDIAAGVGVTFGFYVSYEKGRFIIRMDAGLVCGVGIVGEIVASVSSKHLLEFTKFVYEQLKQNDFAYLYFIEQNAFDYLTHAQMYHLYQVNGLESSEVNMGKVLAWWRQFQHQWNVTHHRDKMAQSWQAAVMRNQGYMQCLYPKTQEKLNQILAYEPKASRVVEND